MPLPRALARFNRVVTNRLLRPLGTVLPNFGVVVHHGRVSGREYRTLVNWWRDEETAIVALTYGCDVDWLKNLGAAGGGVIACRGRTYRLGEPVVIGREGLRRMPRTVRVIFEHHRRRHLRGHATSRARSAHLISTLPDSWEAVASKADS